MATQQMNAELRNRLEVLTNHSHPGGNISALEKNWPRMERECISAQKERDQLQVKLDEMQQKLELGKENVVHIVKNSGRVEEDLMESKIENEGLRNEIIELRGRQSMDEEKITELQKHVKHLEYASLEREKERTDIHAQNKQDPGEDECCDLQSCRKELRDYQEELQKLKENYYATNREFNELMQKVDEKDKEVAVMQTKSNDSEEIIQQLQDEISHLREVNKAKDSNNIDKREAGTQTGVDLKQREIQIWVKDVEEASQSEIKEKDSTAYGNVKIEEEHSVVKECVDDLQKPSQVHAEDIVEYVRDTEEDTERIMVQSMSCKKQEFVDRIIILKEELELMKDERENDCVCYNKALAEKEGEIKVFKQAEAELKVEASELLLKLENMEVELKEKVEAEQKATTYMKTVLAVIEKKEEEYKQTISKVENETNMLMCKQKLACKDVLNLKENHDFELTNVQRNISNLQEELISTRDAKDKIEQQNNQLQMKFADLCAKIHMLHTTLLGLKELLPEDKMCAMRENYSVDDGVTDEMMEGKLLK